MHASSGINALNIDQWSYYVAQVSGKPPRPDEGNEHLSGGYDRPDLTGLLLNGLALAKSREGDGKGKDTPSG